MVKLNPPFGRAVVDVPAELVDRYKEGGWTEVRSPSEGVKPTRTRSTTRRRKPVEPSKE